MKIEVSLLFPRKLIALLDFMCEEINLIFDGMNIQRSGAWYLFAFDDKDGQIVGEKSSSAWLLFHSERNAFHDF
jgi:hypothetical protein